LLNVLSGLYVSSGGEITLAGAAIGALPPHERAARRPGIRR